MLDEREIGKEIARLEYEESSYPNYGKLAVLYTIRAEMQKTEQSKEPHFARLYSAAAAPEAAAQVGSYGDSDFLQTVARKRPAAVWLVLDELMESLRVMQPRTYAAVMRKLDEA